jgi:hypothetical protein
MTPDVKHLRVFVRSARTFGSTQQRGKLQNLADLGQQDKKLEFASWDINTAESRKDSGSLQVAGMKEEAAI